MEGCLLFCSLWFLVIAWDLGRFDYHRSVHEVDVR